MVSRMRHGRRGCSLSSYIVRVVSRSGQMVERIMLLLKNQLKTHKLLKYTEINDMSRY